MKKILSLILTVTMLLSLAVSVSAKGFSDVDENYAWAADSIEALVNEGIIDGFGDGTFRPGESITREQMIKLLSGAIGAFDDANLFFVERAYEMYKDDLADCADSEFIKQGAYLVYRGIMNLDEVVDFLCANNRNLELKRIEAAIFIAKVLDVEEWISVKGNAEIQLNFADSEEILDDYKKYVSCVAEYGIMGSMDDNMFRPKETVTRAQIAVMINRIADKKKFSFVGGTITDIDTLNGYMKVETLDRKIRKIALDTSASIHSDYEGNQYVYTYDEANVFYRLNIGAEISAILSDNKVQEYYIFRNSGEAYKGLYGGVVSSDNGNDIIITDIDNPESKESKKLSENLEVFYNGSYSESCDVLKTGDTITIELEDGVVIRVIGEPASATVENAKVSFIDYADNDEAVITVVDENNEEIKYLVKKDAEIVRNAAVSEVCDLSKGDIVSLELEFGVVSSIKTNNKEVSHKGIVEEITISGDTSYITVSKDDSKIKCILSRECSFTVDKEVKTIHDVKIGSRVLLKASGDEVVEVVAESPVSAMQLTGKVVEVDIASKLIKIEFEENVDGNVQKVTKTIYVKSNAKILDRTSDSETVTLKDIRIGDDITVAGEEKLGLYETDAIMII